MLARSRPDDSCTPACFRAGSVWPKQSLPLLHTGLLLAHWLTSRADVFGQNLTRPSRSDPCQFSTCWSGPSSEEWSWIGCRKSDPTHTTQPDSGCTLAIMSVTVHNQTLLNRIWHVSWGYPCRRCTRVQLKPWVETNLTGDHPYFKTTFFMYMRPSLWINPSFSLDFYGGLGYAVQVCLMWLICNQHPIFHFSQCSVILRFMCFIYLI